MPSPFPCSPVIERKKIDIRDSMNIHKKNYCRAILLLVNITVLSSDDPLRYRKIILE